jgi:asparagine synthase (glutamine-hydrolysing)
MSNEEGTVWITFNGEIYNFQSLREDLVKRGHLFRSATDTETIIHLYEEYGTACVNRLRGMFAFAIWDENRQQLFAARDRVGKKPYYYAETSKGLYFASEIQALYQIPGYSRDLNNTALDLYLAHSYIPSPHTILKGIHKLPPAHHLIYTASGLSVERYWHLSYGPKLDIGYEDARTELMRRLEDATRIRLISDVPLGCFLSGGIDSSIVVALMARASSTPVKTFSIGFSDDVYNEAPYARRLATHYATDHREFLVTPDAVEVIPSLVRHFGEPFADSSALPTWYLSQMTRRHVTVALNGDGGDELFAGYEWYRTGAMICRLKQFVPAMLARGLSSLLGNRPHSSSLRKISRLVELLGKTPAALFADLRTEIRPETRRSIYCGEFARRLVQSAEGYIEEVFANAEFADLLDRMLSTDTLTYLPEELLVKVDRMTMAHSLEGRSPLLDHELMEFVARLPSSFKLRNGQMKYIFRDAARELVPDGFFDRPKMGFSVPLKKWFRGDLSGFVRERILGGPLRDVYIFDMTAVELILRRHGDGRSDSSPLIWRLLMLSEWFRVYGGVLNA